MYEIEMLKCIRSLRMKVQIRHKNHKGGTSKFNARINVIYSHSCHFVVLNTKRGYWLDYSCIVSIMPLQKKCRALFALVTQ